MACKICGRGACASWMHSDPEDNGIERTDRNRTIEELEEALREANNRIADLTTMRAKIPPRPLLYTDTVQGQQVCRDDMWAVTTEELNRMRMSDIEKLQASLANGGSFNGTQAYMPVIKRGFVEKPGWMGDINGEGCDPDVR